MEQFDKDYLDCPHCGINNVTFDILANEKEDRSFPEGRVFLRWGVMHYIIQCSRKECNRLTYFQVLKDWDKKDVGHERGTNSIIFQYPSGKAELPEYIPENIRKYFREAVEAYNYNLLNSASVMCRKVIYELCDKQRATGENYSEKIKDLGLDKRITDPLLNIKNIGDDTVHAKGWDKKTVEKAIDVLGIIIEMIYIQEKRVKDFTKHYSKKKQDKNK
jgi:uncharacterized protein DUF4145